MNEAELLLSEILNCDRLSLYLNKDLILDKDKTTLISSVLKRRIKGEPIQYILGRTEFMGLEFKVNRDVFIPRPETEILVEATVKIVREFASSRVRELKILEIGTGSGCIGVSLAKLLPVEIEITATDISGAALEVAQDNAKLKAVAARIRFINSDLFAHHAIRNTQYDIIISNPPYVVTSEIDDLQPEISYEPRIALDGGIDGLDFYGHLINNSTNYLKEGGFLILEIGFNQREPIENIFQKSGNFRVIEVVKDYNGIDRVTVAQYAQRNTQYGNG